MPPATKTPPTTLPILPLAGKPATIQRAQAQKVILVVEDDAELLEFIAGLLTESNYSVIAAHSGKEALELSGSTKEDIHLLLTAFQMPLMSGVDLATQLRRFRPQIAVLMMSEFPDGVLVLNEGWHFMPKPFIPSQLRALILGTLATAAIHSLA